MGYMHIENLDKNPRLLSYAMVYALEKIDGTSAHISWNERKLSFFSGGASHAEFVKIFDVNALTDKLIATGMSRVMIFGEAYGGKVQGQRKRYGDRLRFVAFDVQHAGQWLAVPAAVELVASLGLEFVSFELVPTTIEALDAQRDADSVQAVRNGLGPGHTREGVVLRPASEGVDELGARLIAKHKRADFQETKTPRVPGVPVEVITDALRAAEEWVTPLRLAHVVGALSGVSSLADTPRVIAAMREDVFRESAGEVIDSPATRKAIGKATVVLWKRHIAGH